MIKYYNVEVSYSYVVKVIGNDEDQMIDGAISIAPDYYCSDNAEVDEITEEEYNNEVQSYCKAPVVYADQTKEVK
jgi:hypothetical protein